MAEKLTKVRRAVLAALASAPSAVHVHWIGSKIGGTQRVSGGRKAYDCLVRIEPFGWVERAPITGHWTHWFITPAGRAALQGEQHDD